MNTVSFGTSISPHKRTLHRKALKLVEDDFKNSRKEAQSKSEWVDYLIQKMISVVDLDGFEHDGVKQLTNRRVFGFCLDRLTSLIQSEPQMMKSGQILALFKISVNKSYQVDILNLISDAIACIPSISLDYKKIQEAILPQILVDVEVVDCDIWLAVAHTRLKLELDESGDELVLASFQKRYDFRKEQMFFYSRLMDLAKTSHRIWRAIKLKIMFFLGHESEYVRVRACELLSMRSGEWCNIADFEQIIDNMGEREFVATFIGTLEGFFLNRLVSNSLVIFMLKLAPDKGEYVQIQTIKFLNQLMMKSLSQTEPFQNSPQVLDRFYQAMLNKGGFAVRRQAAWGIGYLEVAKDKDKLDLLRALYQSYLLCTDRYSLSNEVLYRQGAGLQSINMDRYTIQNYLALITWNSHGLALFDKNNRIIMTKGDRFRFSFWRFLHEMRNPDTTKRQGRPHWGGRKNYGTVKIPSGIICEQVETTVPGEPLYIDEAAGWRPWLPLMADIYGILKLTRTSPLQIVTPDGVTTITAPHGFWQRITTWFKLAIKYESYCKLRNWTTDSHWQASDYVNGLRDLGISIDFKAHSYLMAYQHRSVYGDFGR